MQHLQWDSCCWRTIDAINSQQQQTPVFFREMRFYKEVKTPKDGQLCHYCLPVYMSVPVSAVGLCVLQHSVVRTLDLAVTPFPPQIFPLPSTAVVQTSDLGCTGTPQNNHKYLPNSHMHKLQKIRQIFQMWASSQHLNPQQSCSGMAYLTGTFPLNQVRIVSWNESQFPQYFFMSACVRVWYKQDI